MRQRALIAIGVMLVGCAGRFAPAAPTQPPATDIPFPLIEVSTEPITDEAPLAELATTEPTAEPFIPKITQLTEPPCCVQPFWSIDGKTVMFLDKPPDGELGIYGVPITGGEPELATERVSFLSPDQRYHAYPDASGQTIVEPFNSEVQWVIPNGGRNVYFSPQSTRLAWQKTAQSGNFDDRPTTVFIADIDGSDVKELITVIGGGFGGWLDEDHVLLQGRSQDNNQDLTLFSLNVIDGSRTNIVTNQRIRNTRIAPGGDWIFYTITMHTDDPADDGLWVIKRDGTTRYKLAVIGSAHWRDASHLLIVPYEPDVESHRIWEFDAESGEAYALTDPAVTQFKIAAADWAVSPTGEYIVMLGENEGLWLLSLPPLGYRLP